MQAIETFDHVQQVLYAHHPKRLSRQAYTLEYVRQFLDYIGNPQDKVRVIHVAGTSGKTSTSYFIAGLLHGAGKRVGLAVSPHVYELGERVQIDMQPLPEQEFCQAFSMFMELVHQSAVTLTSFEILYSFAYWQYAQHKVDYAVIEAGMGGLLDATNVVSRSDKVCVITDIGIDHARALGGNIRDIAQHKAGIIGLHNSVFCHSQSSEIMDEIKQACQKYQADLHIVDTEVDIPEPELPLFQKRNLSLAVPAAEWVLGRSLPTIALQHAAGTYIPARMETLTYAGKIVVIDGAHNPQKLHMLSQSLQAAYPNKPMAVLVAFAEGREDRLEACMAELSVLSSECIVTAFETTDHRSLDPALAVAAGTSAGMQVTVCDDPEAAVGQLLARPEPVLLITGSLHLPALVRSFIS